MDELLTTLQHSLLMNSHYTQLVLTITGIIISKNNKNLRWIFAFLFTARLIDTYLLLPFHKYMNDEAEIVTYCFWAFSAYCCYKFLLLRPLFTYKIGTWLQLLTSNTKFNTSQALPSHYPIKFTKTEYLLARIYGGFSLCSLILVLYLLIKNGMAYDIPPGQAQWLINIANLVTGKEVTQGTYLLMLARALNTLLTAAEYILLATLIIKELPNYINSKINDNIINNKEKDTGAHETF